MLHRLLFAIFVNRYCIFDGVETWRLRWAAVELSRRQSRPVRRDSHCRGGIIRKAGDAGTRASDGVERWRRGPTSPEVLSQNDNEPIRCQSHRPTAELSTNPDQINGVHSPYHVIAGHLDQTHPTTGPAPSGNALEAHGVMTALGLSPIECVDDHALLDVMPLNSRGLLAVAVVRPKFGHAFRVKAVAELAPTDKAFPLSQKSSEGLSIQRPRGRGGSPTASTE